MLPIISAALAIADLTGLDDWIGKKLRRSDNGAAKLATKIMDMAQDVTGSADAAAIAKSLNSDPHANAKFRELVESNDQALRLAAYQDRKDARDMYKDHSGQADKIADRIMKWNALYIVIALIANVVAVYYLKDSGAVLATLSSVLGMAIKSLFDERMAVTGFYFGSSMGSKHKDKGG